MDSDVPAASEVTGTGRSDSRAAEPRFWDSVSRLLAGAATEGIRAHKLGALAARLGHRRGEEVPPVLAADERGAAFAMIMARGLLDTVRRQSDGPIVVLKGPEVARLYPGAARGFGDVDLLTPDAHAVQRALRAAGFVEVEEPELFRHHHHLRPLQSPTIALKVELHLAPYGYEGRKVPPLDEIFARAVPSAMGVRGVLAPDPVHHTLILAAHAWNHGPLRLLRDVVDVAAASSGCSPEALERTARSWGIGQVWQTTEATVASLLGARTATVPLLTWARHLPAIRERTVLENHLMRWLHPFWGLPPGQALAELPRASTASFLPAEGELWRQKLRRTRQAVLHPRTPLSTHLVSWQKPPAARMPRDEES